MEIETTVHEIIIPEIGSDNPAFKIHNNLNSIPLEGFNGVQLDLFMGICSIMEGKGDAEEHIPLKRIREECNYKSTSNKRLLKDLEETKEKLRELNYASIETEDFEGDVTLFTVFGKSKKKNEWVVAVNKYATYLLNNLTKQWTAIRIREFTSLRSKYSKLLYKQLMQWRSEGIYIASVENLRKVLDIPESYETKYINSKIMNPSVKELSKFFPGLKSVPMDKERQGKEGRPVTDRYMLLFEPEIAEKEAIDTEYKVEKEDICPLCDQPLVYKRLTEDGNYCWCHTDGYKKNAKCSKIWNTREEIEHAWAVRRKREEHVKNASDGEITIKQLMDYYRHIEEEGKRLNEEKIEKITASIPGIGECMDRQVTLRKESIGLKPGADFKKKREAIRQEVASLEEKIKEMLTENGYPEDSLKRKYICDICRDTGYTDEGRVCSCAKERAKEALEWLQEEKI